jgi:hypothetical protein
MRLLYIIPAPVITFCIASTAIVLILITALQLGFIPYVGAAILLACAAIFAIYLEKPIIFIISTLVWFTFSGLFVHTWSFLPFDIYIVMWVADKYLDELLFLPIFGVFAFHIVQKGHLPARSLLFLWVGLLFLSFLSGRLNGSGFVSTIKFVELYFRYPVVFWVTTLYFDKKAERYRQVTIMLLWFFILQAVADIIWFTVSPPHGTERVELLDTGVGTLGHSHLVSHMTALGIFVSYARIITCHDRSRVAWWGIFLLLCLLFWLGQAKHAIPLLGIGLFLLTGISIGTNVIRRLVVFTVGAIVVVLMILFADYGSYLLAHYTKRWYIPEELEETASVKLQAYKDVYKVLGAGPQALYGTGPGNFASVVGLQNESNLALTYFYKDYEPLEYNPGGSIMGVGSNGMVSIWSELGYGGIILYLGMYAVIFWRILLQIWRREYDHIPYAQTLAMAYCAWVVFYLGLNFIIDAFVCGILPFITWAWAGMVFVPPTNNTVNPEMAISKQCRRVKSKI